MYSPEEIQEKLASLREILYSPKEDVRERIMSLIQEDADPNYRVVKPELMSWSITYKRRDLKRIGGLILLN